MSMIRMGSSTICNVLEFYIVELILGAKTLNPKPFKMNIDNYIIQYNILYYIFMYIIIYSILLHIKNDISHMIMTIINSRLPIIG